MTEETVTKQKTQVGTPAELAAAREARGLSQVDISQRIKLQVRQVNALEEGEWDALPGKSFVRGALRSYGKLLDVDVTALLESVGGFAEPAQVQRMRPLDASISRSSGHGFNGGGRGSPILWVIAGLIGVVALVLYFGSEQDTSRIRSWLPSGDAPSGSTVDPAPAPPLAPSPSSGQAPSVASATADASLSQASSSGPGATGPAAGSGIDAGANGARSSGSSGSPGSSGSSGSSTILNASSVLPHKSPGALSGSSASPSASAGTSASAGAPNPSSTSGSTSAAPTSAGRGVADSYAGVAAAAAAPAAAAASASADRTTAASADAASGTKGLMRFTAGDDAWVEVRQADGSALHNGLLKGGSSIELTGKPPYRLVLGNASRLQLSYEGKAQDLMSHTRANNIARLQLK